jgi:hypothetical protein
LPRRDIEAFFALGRFIAGHPSVEAVGHAGLAGCVRALWWMVEAEVDASEVSLDEATARMMRLLDRQVRIREQMPVRLVYRCRQCRQEEVIDLAPGSRVFRPGGRLVSIKDLDPDYVCSHCHGTEADESLATSCPECGALSKDPVLSECTSPGCLMDFSPHVDPLRPRRRRRAMPASGR